MPSLKQRILFREEYNNYSKLYMTKYRKKIKEKVVEDYPAILTCIECNKDKNFEEFQTDKMAKYGKRNICKECKKNRMFNYGFIKSKGIDKKEHVKKIKEYIKQNILVKHNNKDRKKPVRQKIKMLDKEYQRNKRNINQKRYKQKSARKLTDSYIRNIIITNGFPRGIEIPDDLIKLQRANLLLKRKLGLTAIKINNQ